MEKKKISIVYKKTKDLIPYINNPRINDAGVEPLMNSIEKFGFKQPIVIDRDNEIIAGHTRLKASKELGLEEVPCIIADDLTEEEAKAFRIADNKVAELSDWDFELLENELQELEDFDFEDLGFDDNEISAIQGDIDVDSFFQEDNTEKKKVHEEIQCPHCGETFEV